MSVAEFMRRVSVGHRKLDSETKCTACPGLMLIKSAWLVHLPDPAAEHLPDPLKQDAAAGSRHLAFRVHCVNASDNNNIIRVLLDSAFELKANVAESPAKRALEELSSTNPRVATAINELPAAHTALESSCSQLTSTNKELHFTTLKLASMNALLETAKKTRWIAKEEANAAVRIAELAQRARRAEAASEKVGNERAGLLVENAHLKAENMRLGAKLVTMLAEVEKVHIAAKTDLVRKKQNKSTVPLPPSSPPPPLPPSSPPPALPSTPRRAPSPASSDMALSPVSTSLLFIQSPIVRNKPAFPFRRGAPPASPPPSSPIVAAQRPKSRVQPTSSLFFPSRPHPSLPPCPTSAVPNTVVDSLLLSRGGPSPRKRSRAAYESHRRFDGDACEQGATAGRSCESKFLRNSACCVRLQTRLEACLDDHINGARKIAFRSAS
ncbi:hypothetical protein C8F04DRAFT_1256396 [Mycena alexandri]|uniref:Uncharacterized protein n=1 Tax=Mycena alexandri TaxID=1745969 RepID=A0AAD6T1B2_9AGAR|nr:hypothetical protein C8F04DRAFT_1256396 [Mycena alexandri]